MMNKEVMFSSKTDMWETPQCFFDALNAEFGFTCDVCALPENAKCEKYFTPDQDGLLQEWTGVCWCNPPYGRQIGKWVQKAAQSKCTVVMLLPARTDTRWYHEWIHNKAEVRFLRGRLKFGGCQNSAPFPSMVVVFRRIEGGAKMDIDQCKERIYVVLRELAEDVSTLIVRMAKAYEDLAKVQTEEDAKVFDRTHDLEVGLKHIRLF